MSNYEYDDNSFLFLKSIFASEGNFLPTSKIIDWIEYRNSVEKVQINKINFSELEKWQFIDNKLKHDSGNFFNIEGIRITTNWGSISGWDQPIINQHEVGYLGFITKEFNGVLHFLLQAKIEPGNVNCVQLSPTLQATRSNYTQIHKGKKPLYLEYFQNATSQQILLDQLQSEQGARFLKKRNRNIIIKIDEDIPLYDNFTWVTLGQIKQLMTHNNLVNMDTRTVISGISYGNFNHDVIDFFYHIKRDFSIDKIEKYFFKSAVVNQDCYNSTDAIISFLTHLKSIYDLEIDRIALNDMKNWVITDKEIVHEQGKYFKVIGVNVEIENREVVRWTQPMFEPAQEGLCAFVCKVINGIMHFAVQAKLECGNFDIIEFAPTVQCLTDDYRQTKKGRLPFLDYVLNAKKDQIFFDTIQSEEGGRFFREQNRNMIVIAGDDISNDLPNNYIWMTLNQLQTFLHFNNFLNIQARSLIAAISFG